MLICNINKQQGAAKAYSLARFKRLVLCSSSGFGSSFPMGSSASGRTAENQEIAASSKFGKGA